MFFEANITNCRLRITLCSKFESLRVGGDFLDLIKRGQSISVVFVC